MHRDHKELKVLIGKTLASVEKISDDSGEDRIIFTTDDNVRYTMEHTQNCCENVSIDDVCGDLNDLVGASLLIANESTNNENPRSDQTDTHTWTFYRFATVKGYVCIKWYGSSNGYYSESVDFWTWV